METFYVERYEKTRFFAVRDAAGTHVCVCVYRRGAEEVAQRLQALDDAQRWADANGPTRTGRRTRWRRQRCGWTQCPGCCKRQAAARLAPVRARERQGNARRGAPSFATNGSGSDGRAATSWPLALPFPLVRRVVTG